MHSFGVSKDPKTPEFAFNNRHSAPEHLYWYCLTKESSELDSVCDVLDPDDARHRGKDAMIRSSRNWDQRLVLRQAMAELTRAAEAVDWLSRDSVTSISLLEASRAIHNALVVLEELSSSSNERVRPG